MCNPQQPKYEQDLARDAKLFANEIENIFAELFGFPPPHPRNEPDYDEWFQDQPCEYQRLVAEFSLELGTPGFPDSLLESE